MLLKIMLAAAVIASVPAAASAAPKKAASVAAKKAPAKPAVDPAEMMAMMTRMFDRLFPAGPEIEPARLAAAQATTLRMFPKGTYGEAINGFTERMTDHVLSMSEADLAEMMPPTPPKKGEKAKVPSRVPLRQMLAEKEPNFDAKLAAGKAFAKTMIVKFGDVAEPKFREGMARSMALKFDARQLGEIDAFLATPTGALYGRQMVGLWFDPEVVRGTFQAFPEMMKLVPDMAKDAAALDAIMKDTAKGSAKEK